MNRRILCLLIGFVLFSAAFSSETLMAAPFYEKKVLKINVGSEVGTGYDRVARVLAKYLPRHIPGKPTVVIENMTGASGISQANYLYNIVKPDGLTIGTFVRGICFAQLMKAPGVRFDLAKFSWIGSAAVEATVFVVRADLPYETFADLQRAKDPIKVAGTGVTSDDYQFAMFLKEFLGINFKTVIYLTSAQCLLAIERKEADARVGSYSSMLPYIERGLVRPLIRGPVSKPGIENLPVNEDLANDKKVKTMMGMLSAPTRFGRPYVAPPGVPKDVMDVLRDAFAKMAKDPELQEESKKLMLDIEYVPADECLKVLAQVLDQPESIMKEFSKYVKF